MNEVEHQVAWPRRDAHIESLLRSLTDNFSAIPIPKNISVVNYGIGDEFGARRVAEAFSGSWTQVTSDHVRSAGPDMLFHLSAAGFLYYLPAIFSSLLRERDFGWLEEALLPGVVGYEDVVDYFSDGTLRGERGDTAKRYFSRVDFIKYHLTCSQRECVAQYIEIAETYKVQILEDGILTMVGRYAGFWRDCP